MGSLSAAQLWKVTEPVRAGQFFDRLFSMLSEIAADFHMFCREAAFKEYDMQELFDDPEYSLKVWCLEALR